MSERFRPPVDVEGIHVGSKEKLQEAAQMTAEEFRLLDVEKYLKEKSCITLSEIPGKQAALASSLESLGMVVNWERDNQHVFEEDEAGVSISARETEGITFENTEIKKGNIATALSSIVQQRSSSLATLTELRRLEEIQESYKGTEEETYNSELQEEIAGQEAFFNTLLSFEDAIRERLTEKRALESVRGKMQKVVHKLVGNWPLKDLKDATAHWARPEVYESLKEEVLKERPLFMEGLNLSEEEIEKAEQTSPRDISRNVEDAKDLKAAYQKHWKGLLEDLKSLPLADRRKKARELFREVKGIVDTVQELSEAKGYYSQYTQKLEQALLPRKTQKRGGPVVEKKLDPKKRENIIEILSSVRQMNEHMDDLFETMQPLLGFLVANDLLQVKFNSKRPVKKDTFQIKSENRFHVPAALAEVHDEAFPIFTAQDTVVHGGGDRFQQTVPELGTIGSDGKKRTYLIRSEETPGLAAQRLGGRLFIPKKSRGPRK
jgi:hypothetical protein